jgi:xanthosine utilization system XapX-like protein
MPKESPELASESIRASSHNGPATGQIFLYFGSLTLLVYLATPSGYLVDIATSYMLKDNLHATASQVSMFRLLTGIPIYVAFVFGLIRDLWSPFGLRDRGYFLLFAPLTAAAFVWLAFSRLSYGGLLVGVMFAMLSFRFVMAAYQALIALIGQEKLMTGRLSTLWSIVSYIPLAAAAFASGWVAEHLQSRQTFLLIGALAFLVVAIAVWKPGAVFGQAYDAPQSRGAGFVGDLKRLVKHRAVYPAVLIMFLWNFAPGSATPLQFYLTNQLHASNAAFANYNGIFVVSFIPTLLLYGYLCKRISLNKLLWWGTIVAIPQMVPLAFIHSGTLAQVLAAPIGLMGGVATAAYFDLAMRSCPPGLHGTLMMLVDGVYVLSQRGGDVLGSKIYNSSPAHGFLYCVIATTAVYALILPLILLIPKKLISTSDGEPNAAVGATG